MKHSLAALAAGLATVMLLATGCAAVPTAATDVQTASAAQAASAPPATGSPALRVSVQAPAALRSLLETYLDVARLAELARGETLDAVELDRLVAAAPAQAKDLLQTEGYFDAQVKAEREGSQLRLVVVPGQRTTVSRLTVELQGPLAEAADAGEPRASELLRDWTQGWALPAGSAFRNPAWSSAKTDALTRLNTAGYASASFAGTAAEVDAETASARLFVVADSGPLYRSGELSISGLVHQDEQTVRNLAGFAPGTPLTETLLLDFQERLRTAGLYNTVSVDFRPDPDTADATQVSVRLTELPRQVWTFGLGVSADNGPRASVEHRHRRAFGWAATTRNKLEIGRRHQAWNGEISTHPLERQYRWLLAGEIDRLESDYDVVQSQSLRLGRALNTARIDRFTFVEIERSSRDLIRLERSVLDSRELAVSLNHHGVWRRLDDLLLPTRGYSLSLQGGVGYGTGDPGSNGVFTRAYGRLIGYTPLPGGWYGQARVEAGQVFRPGDVPVPDSQQFRAGGDESVRGYAFRSLGPEVDGVVDSGDVLLTGSLEVARPIVASLPSVWGALFIDAGRAAPRWRDLDPAVGYGVGVRWRGPIGALRVDLAYGEELRKLRLHFSVGITY
jgi:translocation and assembly module TamA